MSNNIFNIEKIDFPEVKYVLGVDTLDDDANAYCLMRVSGDNKEVILCKSLKKGDDFDSEINNLARYFDADLVMTEYGKVVNKPAEAKHFWATECYTNWGSMDEKIQNIQFLELDRKNNDGLWIEDAVKIAYEIMDITAIVIDSKQQVMGRGTVFTLSLSKNNIDPKNIPFKVGKYVKLRNDSILYEIKGVEAMLGMNGIKDNIGLVVKKVVKDK